MDDSAVQQRCTSREATGERARPGSGWRGAAALACCVGLLCSVQREAGAHSSEPAPREATGITEVSDGYASLAFVLYQDALAAALGLQRAIDGLLKQPSARSLEVARGAWLEAHRRYSLTEALRFGNPNVDAWEGSVNAWPIDEGFIDYVGSEYTYDLGNPFARENLIASAAPLNTGTLRLQHERGGLEPNVAIGFHAIEFLLWGQDGEPRLAAPGQRAHTDFVSNASGEASEACSHEPCGRRADYLRLLSNLLVFDLRAMVEDWRAGSGGYRDQFSTLEPNERLRRMLEGLGTMSAGELAGERLQVALIAHSQEDEQSCFSDSTHWAILYNVMGIEALYRGQLGPSGGPAGAGPGLEELLTARSPELASQLDTQLRRTRRLAEAVVRVAEEGEPFDLQIQPDHGESRARIEHLIASLGEQGESFEAAGRALGIVIGGAPSADADVPDMTESR